MNPLSIKPLNIFKTSNESRNKREIKRIVGHSPYENHNYHEVQKRKRRRKKKKRILEGEGAPVTSEQ